MTREERVGAPPPPAKKFGGHQNTLGAKPKAAEPGAKGSGHAYADPKLNKPKGGKGGAAEAKAAGGALGGTPAPPLPPPLLERSEDGVTMRFTTAAEAQLLSKLELVLGKLGKVARDPADVDDAPKAAATRPAAAKPGRPRAVPVHA